MSNKLSPVLIIRGQVETLRDANTDKIRSTDIVSFYVIPIAVSAVIVIGFRCPLDGNTLNIIATSLSIFGALLFNLLMLLIDRARRVKETPDHSDEAAKRNVLIREMYMNISYSVLVCVTSVAVVVAKVLLMARFPESEFTKKGEPVAVLFAFRFCDLIILCLVIHFLAVMLMVLKRTHLLFKQEMPDAT